MAAVAYPEQVPPQEDAMDEELEDLPELEKQADPLRHARIARTVDGTEYEGEVEDIECGKVTRERLYRIKYTDGDLEHLTAAQVKEMQTSRRVASAEQVPAQEEGDDVEEELEELPELEKQADPLRHARIKRTVDGTEFEGEVEDIERGRITREWLYRIKYADGDLEHLTAAQVREMQITRRVQTQPE
eukprot:CAMPEP_0168409666 /NCGR_PEP_ID=MMETSP0228-20121227/27301_1 /TAXON_ID=133427 /ORGANISM="Protoceratium reticulatum, Strain CCCM 535 (=CCMP 1889)" /LENGTH=187 /DNA_ID=CAMNT_0008423385 /DNA_START=56 /DNA_END=616 /DNA_ORIENTATION=+